MNSHRKETYLSRQGIASGNDDEIKTVEGTNLLKFKELYNKSIYHTRIVVLKVILTLGSVKYLSGCHDSATSLTKTSKVNTTLVKALIVSRAVAMPGLLWPPFVSRSTLRQWQGIRQKESWEVWLFEVYTHGAHNHSLLPLSPPYTQTKHKATMLTL